MRRERRGGRGENGQGGEGREMHLREAEVCTGGERELRFAQTCSARPGGLCVPLERVVYIHFLGKLSPHLHRIGPKKTPMSKMSTCE